MANEEEEWARQKELAAKELAAQQAADRAWLRKLRADAEASEARRAGVRVRKVADGSGSVAFDYDPYSRSRMP